MSSNSANSVKILFLENFYCRNTRIDYEKSETLILLKEEVSFSDVRIHGNFCILLYAWLNPTVISFTLVKNFKKMSENKIKK